MNEGDIALAPLPQANGQIKNRPVVLLRRLPPFGDFLVCGGISEAEKSHQTGCEWSGLMVSDGSKKETPAPVCRERPRKEFRGQRVYYGPTAPGWQA